MRPTSEILDVPIADLVPDPANVRTHSPRNIEAIRGSLARFGQQKPIVISPQKVVVAGNGTLEAARDLGWETVQAVCDVIRARYARAVSEAHRNPGPEQGV